MKIWKLAALAKNVDIVEIYITEQDLLEELDEIKKTEKFYSPGGAFDAPVYQIVRFDKEYEFYTSISNLYKKVQAKEYNLYIDAKRNLNPYIIKGKNKYPEMFI